MIFDSKKYYIDTKIPSEISNIIINDIDKFDWGLGAFNDQFQVKKTDDNGNWIGIDQNLIQQDSFLKEIHYLAQGELSLVRFPPNTMYNWHVDKNNLLNINLVFEELPAAYSMFRLQEGDFDKNTVHRSLYPVMPVKYTPHCWLIYNAQIEHTVLNLSNRTRYLLTYTIKKDQTYIHYNHMLSITLKDPKWPILKKLYEKIPQKNINS